ncbi:MAG: hypothetical protein WD578_09335 [Bacteroidales bacterium]
MVNNKENSEIELRFREDVFPIFPFSIRDFLTHRNVFQFLTIKDEKKPSIYIDKNRYEFSIKKFQKFGLDEDAISVFWLVTEFVSLNIYDAILGLKYVVEPNAHPKKIQELKEVLKLHELFSENDWSIKDFVINMKHKSRDEEFKVHLTWNLILKDFINHLLKNNSKENQKYREILFKYENELIRVKSIKDNAYKDNARRAYNAFNSLITMHYDSHYNILVGYTLLLNNFYKFKSSRISDRTSEIHREEIFSYDPSIDNQKLKSKPTLYQYEINLRNSIRDLLGSIDM